MDQVASHDSDIDSSPSPGALQGQGVGGEASPGLSLSISSPGGTEWTAGPGSIQLLGGPWA